jgi:ferrous iron transport protein B
MRVHGRIAFIMDRIMRSIGLSGKSIIPAGHRYGMLRTRHHVQPTIEHQRERELTVIVTHIHPLRRKMPPSPCHCFFFRQMVHRPP